MRIVFPFMIVCLFVLSWGCSAPQKTAQSTPPVARTSRPQTQSNRPAAQSPPQFGPIAYVNGRAVPWDDIRQPLIEAAGGQVLVEWVLDHAIEKEVTRRKLTLPDNAIAAEKEIMINLFSDDPNQGARLLQELRNRRGLGKTRYEQLLQRNASLRMLVQDEVEVSEANVQLAFQQQYGTLYEARLIVVDDVGTAGQVVQMARDGDDFVQLVKHHSVDPSREQGGILPPISLADPTYPASIRKALKGMLPGQVSDPVVVQRGFAILRLDRLIEAKPVRYDDVKRRVERRVRREIERVLMARLARTLLEQSDVVTLDPEMQSGWEQAQKSISAE